MRECTKMYMIRFISIASSLLAGITDCIAQAVTVGAFRFFTDPFHKLITSKGKLRYLIVIGKLYMACLQKIKSDSIPAIFSHLLLNVWFA